MMTSITLPTHVHNDEEKDINVNSYPTDKCRYVFQWSTSNPIIKTNRASSYTEERTQPSTPVSNTNNTATNNNRFKDLCTRFKRRFSITKDYHKHSEDINRGLSVRFSNYKSISSTVDGIYNDFDWPDFEKVYDSIPVCLARTLPGLDDLSLEDDDEDDNTDDSINFITDELDEQMDLYENCKRGKTFRRNAICSKLDKTQYNGQLDTFIQQLMIEKLMRTWT